MCSIFHFGVYGNDAFTDWFSHLQAIWPMRKWFLIENMERTSRCLGSFQSKTKITENLFCHHLAEAEANLIQHLIFLCFFFLDESRGQRQKLAIVEWFTYMAFLSHSAQLWIYTAFSLPRSSSFAISILFYVASRCRQRNFLAKCERIEQCHAMQAASVCAKEGNCVTSHKSAAARVLLLRFILFISDPISASPSSSS